MSTMTASAAWYADPTGRHEYRYWDGTAWTENVADGGVATADPPTITRANGDDGRVDALVAEAMATIDAHVDLRADGADVVMGTGSESPLMGAAEAFERAVDQRPDDPVLRYAWISALATAAQWKAARDRMEELAEAHPEFLPARFAVGGWETWTPVFMLPPWSPSTTDPHPRLRAYVKGRVLLATRDGIEPRATLFLRDAGGELEAASVRTARVDLAIVVSPTSISPQVVALYVRIWDNPDQPYLIEALALPLTPRGSASRNAHELLCAARDLDFVVLGADDAVVVNRRLGIPAGMRSTLQELLERLLAEDGAVVAPDVATTACQRHTTSFPMDAVPFEPATSVPA